MRTSFLDQPIRGLLKRGMLGRNAGFRQRDDANGSVPNRRQTRLNAKIFRVIDKQSGKIFVRLGVNRICFCVTQDPQSNHGIQHCWINGREAVAAFTNAFDHPALRFLKRPPPQRTNPKRPQEFENVVYCAERNCARSRTSRCAVAASRLARSRTDRVRVIACRRAKREWV